MKKHSFQKSETVLLIPVVIHVIYKNAQENISLNQIMTQLDALNNDFRKRNADTTIIEPEFSKADVKIEFCLAKRDPQGNVTTGINRISTNIDNIGTSEQYYVIQPAWNRDLYLNIWVGDYGTDGQGNDILGRASPPGEPNANKDGVIINYKAFGTLGTAVSPYNKGRTTTHEVGHWLGLYHPWGVNGVSCADDDLVSDTPNQGVVYYNCPTNPRSSCGSKDMLSNYMGYVDDRCMANFSEGQKTRMRNTLVLQRSSILLSTGCLPVGIEEHQNPLSGISIFPNPVNDQLNFRLKEGVGRLELKIYDLGGRIVLRKEIDSELGEFSISTDGIQEGIYLLELRSENSFHRSKLIVQH